MAETLMSLYPRYAPGTSAAPGTSDASASAAGTSAFAAVFL